RRLPIDVFHFTRISWTCQPTETPPAPAGPQAYTLSRPRAGTRKSPPDTRFRRAFRMVGATGFEPATSTTPRFSQVVPSQSANVRKRLYKGVSASRDILPASVDVRQFPGVMHT